MTGKERLIKDLADELESATAEDQLATLTYFECLNWIRQNEGLHPEAEQTLELIQEIVDGKTCGDKRDVVNLTYKLEDLITAYKQGLK